ncbi:MAG: energy-coupling factor transporter ATPase [Candidatus Muiribacterium halophilum]|uniref:Energy-coupling factor transporter ATPase n=1 Tax=Muiribacterium halophilum TaxID=2053465 RepID=A0A2N5Z9M2_MUIH1|nr:MAG: energy-coupling factor transporter ATPase [Candidatus Muirbacterium halophilum]
MIVNDTNIKVDSVSFTYNNGSIFQKQALQDISFEINNKDILGICGNTGSGKSTLIRLLNRLIKPDSGFVKINDVDLSEIKDPMEIRRKVGIIFQYPDNQLFESSVKKELVYGPLNFGFKKREALSQARDSLNRTGLDYHKYKNRNPFSLSGGEKRKVAIASILSSRPEVIIFDEPTAGLDSNSRDNLIELIFSLKKEGRMIIIISHDSRFIDKVCDKLLVLSKSKQVYFGDREEFFSRFDKSTIDDVGIELPFEYKVLRADREKNSIKKIKEFINKKHV